MLWNWGRVYQSVQQMSPVDRPDEDVIAHDGKFDSWMERYQRDIAIQAAKQRRARNTG